MTDNRTDTENSNLQAIDNKNANIENTDAKSANVENANVENNSVDLQTKTLATPLQTNVTDTNVAKTNSGSKINSTTDSAVTANKSTVNNSEKSSVQNDASKRDSQPVDKTANTMTNSNSQETTIKETQSPIKKLNIVIAGATYTIYCPADEEAELRAAENYLNNFATNIKKDSPKLNQENLLVLSCLNLYEKINTNEVSAAERQQQSKQNESLLNKIMQDAHSML